MKELYTSPELKVTCFAPVERLAANEGIVNFPDLLAASGSKNPASTNDNDIKVDLN